MYGSGRLTDLYSVWWGVAVRQGRIRGMKRRAKSLVEEATRMRGSSLYSCTTVNTLTERLGVVCSETRKLQAC